MGARDSVFFLIAAAGALLPILAHIIGVLDYGWGFSSLRGHFTVILESVLWAVPLALVGKRLVTYSDPDILNGALIGMCGLSVGRGLLLISSVADNRSYSPNVFVLLAGLAMLAVLGATPSCVRYIRSVLDTSPTLISVASGATGLALFLSWGEMSPYSWIVVPWWGRGLGSYVACLIPAVLLAAGGLLRPSARRGFALAASYGLVVPVVTLILREDVGFLDWVPAWSVVVLLAGLGAAVAVIISPEAKSADRDTVPREVLG
jgi:hypothetical protein